MFKTHSPKQNNEDTTKIENTDKDEMNKLKLEIQYLYVKLGQKEELINRIADHPFIPEDILEMIRQKEKIEQVAIDKVLKD